MRVINFQLDFIAHFHTDCSDVKKNNLSQKNNYFDAPQSLPHYDIIIVRDKIRLKRKIAIGDMRNICHDDGGEQLI